MTVEDLNWEGAETWMVLSGTFEWAISNAKRGKKVRRKNWKDASAFLFNDVAHMAWSNESNCVLGWAPVNEDLFATDWELYVEPQPQTVFKISGLSAEERQEVRQIVGVALRDFEQDIIRRIARR